eukprot:Polyplicarium_translucidae@DN2494_c0_g1_i1.p1
MGRRDVEDVLEDVENTKGPFVGLKRSPRVAVPLSVFHARMLLGLSVIFIATTAPAFWGKPDLEILLLRNGAFSWCCSADDIHSGDPPACTCQRELLSNAFTVAVASLKVAGLFLGPVVDWFGPKLTGISGQMLFLFGVGLLAFSNTTVLVFVGFVAMGASMNPVYNSTISVSNLFPRNRNLVMALLSSGGDAALWVFLLLRLAHDHFRDRIGVTSLLVLYGGVIVSQAAVAAVFWPRESFKIQLSPQYKKEVMLSLHEQRHSMLPLVDFDALPTEPLIAPDIQTAARDRNFSITGPLPDPPAPVAVSLRSDLGQLRYWAFLPMFTLFFFTKAFVMDTLRTNLEGMPHESPDQINDAVMWFAVINGFAFVWAWMFGVLAGTGVGVYGAAMSRYRCMIPRR